MATVTIRSIAQHTGLSKSTVAAALKGDPRYSTETIKAVKKAARELGYYPNSLVTAAMTRIRDGRKFDSGHATICYLSDIPLDALMEDNHPGGENRNPKNRLGYLGAKDRAKELGFGLDLIHYPQSGMSSDRLRSILRARGIQGLIIAPHVNPQVSLDLKWDEFAVICIGFSVQTPKFDRVGFNHYEAINDTCIRMHQSGKKRIGLVLSQDYDSRVSYVTRAAFLRWQSDLESKGARIPVAIVRNKLEVAAWYKRHKPDCIVAHGEEILEMLDDLNLEEGNGTIVVSLSLIKGFEKWGGYDMSLRILASSAVNMIAGKLYRNGFGIPENRHTALVLGPWNERQSPVP